MSPRHLTQSEFMALPENSFDFYSVLPTDPLQLDGQWEKSDLETLASGLLSLDDFRGISDSDLDRLACALLLNGPAPLANDLDWYSLADRMAIVYMQQFKEGGVHSTKMRAGRVNFFLRDILECHFSNAVGVISRRVLPHRFPWDWISIEGGELVVDSGANENFHYLETTGISDCWRAGLPTQVDFLSGEEFSVTSCFSDGWFLWRINQTPIYQAHQAPVVTVFEFDQNRYLLDAQGCIYSLRDGRLLLRLPSGSAWRARFIDDTLYAFCLGVPYRMFGICMEGLKIDEIDTGPVIIPNDICKIENSFYMIDKMQGKVFSFDSFFNLREERMSFGRGKFALYDPISLRAFSGSLWALSWMTNSITRLELF